MKKELAIFIFSLMLISSVSAFSFSDLLKWTGFAIKYVPYNITCVYSGTLIEGPSFNGTDPYTRADLDLYNSKTGKYSYIKQYVDSCIKKKVGKVYKNFTKEAYCVKKTLKSGERRDSIAYKTIKNYFKCNGVCTNGACVSINQKKLCMAVASGHSINIGIFGNNGQPRLVDKKTCEYIASNYFDDIEHNLCIQKNAKSEIVNITWGDELITNLSIKCDLIPSSNGTVYVYEGNSIKVLQLIPLAYENGILKNPVLFKDRNNTDLIMKFKNNFPNSSLVLVNEANINQYVQNKIQKSNKVVIVSPSNKKLAIIASLYGSVFDYPLVFDSDNYNLTNKECIDFSGTSLNCKSKQNIAPEQASTFLVSEYKRIGIEPNYIILTNEADPLSPASAYLGAFRHAVPFFVSSHEVTDSKGYVTIIPDSSSNETMNLLKQSVLGYQLKPKYLAIVGSHPYIPSDYLFDLFHSDFQYTQFDTDQYPDVLFGRLVTIDLQDIFTQLNNIFYYDITAKNVKYKADIHFCNSGLTSSGSTFDCFSTSEKQICSLAGYLQSKGFNVHTYEDSGMNQTSFINSLSNSGVIFKENHGNQWGTSLSDSFFTASNIPLMNPTTYLTGSCLTADYPAVLPREDSYILSYFRNNGIGYLGAMSPGQSLINKIGFISKGEKQSNIAYNGIEGVGDGVTYFGDPAFNPHYIPDNESKINYTFSKISANSYQLDVEIPASETIFYCNAGLFPKRFDYYASRLNGDYVYGVQVKRFEIDNSQNKIISANLTRYEFDSQQNPVQAECTGPASKQEQQSYFCTTFQPNRNDLFITIKGTGSQVEIFSCDIDKDIFNNKTYVLCHLSTPYAPLDAEKINIAKLKEYNIDIRTSS